MVERVLKNLIKRKVQPRRDFPGRTRKQIAEAITAGIWWGTVDGMRESVKDKLIKEIMHNRARRKVVVVTGTKGSITRGAVKKAIGEAATKRVYKKLKLSKAEIAEAKEFEAARLARKKRVVPVRPSARVPARVAANPYEYGRTVGRQPFGPTRRMPRKPDMRERRRFAPNPQLLLITGNPPEDDLDFSDPKRPPDFKRFSGTREFKAALKQHKKFHGVAPDTIDRQWVEGSVPHASVVMGEAPDIAYHVRGASKKQKKVPFKHDFKGKVYAATNAKGKVMYYIPDAKKGKRVRVTDWIRG
jgi:hypothetical protein